MSYRYENLYIMHYGVGHDKGGHSGRYPWGSGERPYGGVNPKTKAKELLDFKRTPNDILSDVIVTKRYGDRKDVSEIDIAKSKHRTMAFLRGVENTALVTLAGIVGGPASYALVGGAVANNWIGRFLDYKLVDPDMIKKINEDKIQRKAIKRANVVITDPDIIKDKVR